MHPRPRLALRVAWDLLRIRFLHRGVKRVDAEGTARIRPGLRAPFAAAIVPVGSLALLA